MYAYTAWTNRKTQVPLILDCHLAVDHDLHDEGVALAPFLPYNNDPEGFKPLIVAIHNAEDRQFKGATSPVIPATTLFFLLISPQRSESSQLPQVVPPVCLRDSAPEESLGRLNQGQKSLSIKVCKWWTA